MRALVMAILAGAAASLAEPAHAIEGEAAKGKALVTQKCSRCHGIGADDASTHEKAPPFREVVTRYPLDNLEEALAEGIMSGHPDMPEFEFKTGEIADILAYLQSLKVPTGPAPEPAARP